jgi:hypothetical protein
MRKIRAALIAVALTAIVLAIAPAASGASAANVRCVGHPPCFATLQKAIDAAHDGGVILVEPGTYAGGVTIDKSVEVIGSGASRTIIKGGGPVLTIGKAFAQSEPKVTISKVKITGGRTTSSPLSKEFVDKKNVIALGGGIAIPPGKFIKDEEHFADGATVKVTDSVISGNRVGPSATVPSEAAACPGGPCPFAVAGGGGIDNWGALSLERTDVSDNRAAGVASDATGGGIDSPQGNLDLRDSTLITDNRAIVGVPNGRYAEGGGIFTGGILSNDAPVAVRVRGGAINDNEASLTSKLPYFVGDGKGSTVDMNANGAGAHFGGGSSISIANTRINENKLSVDDPKGEPYAFDSALHISENSKLDLRHSTIKGNLLRAKVGSSEHAGPSGAAIDIDGPSTGSHAATVSHVRITGNTTLVTSEDGEAQAAPGAIYNADATRITHSVISGNRLTARSADGSASAFGAGVINEGRLVLQHDLIEDNHAIATGPDGFARGGGIWNGILFEEETPHLTLNHTRVIGNTLRASPGLPVKGGGLFTAFPVTLNHSQIAHNLPDQCAGSGCKKGS